MDTAAARSQLLTMLRDLDRSMAVLKGEHSDDRHPADAGTSLSDADRIEAALEAMERQRTAVQAALGRLESGTYGLCVDCGALVPEGRLEARPDAARCVSCQGKLDRARR